METNGSNGLQVLILVWTNILQISTKKVKMSNDDLRAHFRQNNRLIIHSVVTSFVMIQKTNEI